MKNPDELRILLIQLRKDPQALIAERENFLRHSRLKDGCLISLDFFRNPNFDPKDLLKFDAFFMGGISDDPSDTVAINIQHYPFLKSLRRLLRMAESSCIPGLLSCGGFMLASHLWGSEIVLDPRRREMGVYDLDFYPHAREDIFLGHLPGRVKIVSGHLKSTKETPPECFLMAKTSLCPIHVIKHKAAPLYAFQGHPEITTTDLKARVAPYKTKYFKNNADYEQFTRLKADTSSINSLLSVFIGLVASDSFT